MTTKEELLRDCVWVIERTTENGPYARVARALKHLLTQPDGVWVPREPTQAMLDAGAACLPGRGAKSLWYEMLSAAPLQAAPVQTDGDKTELTEDELMDVLKKTRPFMTENQYEALTITRWKDGIDVDYPSGALRALAHFVLLSAQPPAGNGVKGCPKCGARCAFHMKGCEHDGIDFTATPSQEAPAEVREDEARHLSNHPQECPITGAPFFMTIEHPERGEDNNVRDGLNHDRSCEMYSEGCGCESRNRLVALIRELMAGKPQENIDYVEQQIKEILK